MGTSYFRTGFCLNMSSSCVSESVAASETHAWALPRPRKRKCVQKEGTPESGDRSVVEARAWAWRLAHGAHPRQYSGSVFGALGPVPLPTKGLQSKIEVKDRCVIINVKSTW